ncbi:hypothetical protein GWK47_045803 [Chionoecetes opilio]|uniref:Uncharacterized protein n=1 Tax=Chionoecetes opilio TaxID=41210 RepID=A0A8J5CV22_CHIOP|nr:hypothetical protein GWK47_045803 [Chionoecetes opilio]
MKTAFPNSGCVTKTTTVLTVQMRPHQNVEVCHVFHRFGSAEMVIVLLQAIAVTTIVTVTMVLMKKTVIMIHATTTHFRVLMASAYILSGGVTWKMIAVMAQMK